MEDEVIGYDDLLEGDYMGNDYYSEHDGQPTEYEEWQDYMDGDDGDHGQYDNEY
jgi:hypothetical protein